MEEYRKAARKLDDRNVWRWLASKTIDKIVDIWRCNFLLRQFLLNTALMCGVVAVVSLYAAFIAWLTVIVGVVEAMLIFLASVVIGVGALLTNADNERRKLG